MLLIDQELYPIDFFKNFSLLHGQSIKYNLIGCFLKFVSIYTFFLYSEEDLDDVLILQTKVYNCAHTFLGRSGFAGSLRGTSLLGSLPHITSRVHTNANITEQCKCGQISNFRPSKAPRTQSLHFFSAIFGFICQNKSIDNFSRTLHQDRSIKSIKNKLS